MQIKVFKAETMKEAMEAMKAELGEDAVVLHSRKYKKGGFLGFGGKEIIEITAAVEVVPLNERVRGIYRKPVQQTLPNDLLEDENNAGNGAEINSTFNDDLPIHPPSEISDAEGHHRTQSEKLAETVRNAQNPTEEIEINAEEVETSQEKISEEKISEVAETETSQEKISEEISEEKISEDAETETSQEKVSEENISDVPETETSVEESARPEKTSRSESVTDIPPTEDEEPELGEEETADSEEKSVPDENISEENVPEEKISEENLPPVDEEELPLEEQFVEDVPPDSLYSDEPQQGFGFTPDQLAQAQAMMFAQFNQYQMAVAQMQMQAQVQAQAEVAEMAEQMRELHRRRLSTAGKTDTVKLARMTPEEKKIHHLENEVARMKNLLTGVMGRGSSPNSVTLREALTYQEIDEEILDEMEADTSIGDTSADVLSSAARLTLSNYLEEHLKFSGGIKLNRHGPRIVAMLGTTGVGKTTTLAKIAAKFALEHRIEAVLVTADTYRISAVEQLKTYSDILGLPLEIVYSPAELNAVIDKHKNRELILIDTAGRSRNSFQQMQELKDLMSVHSRIEKHLVISATTKITDARDMIDKFSIVEPEKIIITKVDETGSLGMVLNLLKDSNLMLSYFTTGQGVPEDIELANVNILTDLILKKIVGE